MKKLLAILLAVLTCASLSLVGCSATLNDWNAPTYANVNVGDTVFVQTVTATDTNNGIHTATVQVIGPKGAVEVNGQTFVASDAGNYSVVYEINGVQKVATFTAGSSNSGNNSGNNGGNNSGNSGNNGSSTTDSILGALIVTPSDDPCFEVSGNTVTVLKTVDVTEYQSIGWDLTGWTMTNGANIKITVKNNTTGLLDVKYKVVTNSGDQYGDRDLAIAAGQTDTFSGPTGTVNLPSPTSVTKIELFIGAAAKGTFTVDAHLIGQGGGSSTDIGTTTLGAMRIYEDDDTLSYFTLSGKTLTIKQAIPESKYKSVLFDVSNWDKTKAATVSYSVKSTVNAPVTIKYKATTDKGVAWGYPDLVVNANGTNSAMHATTTNDQPNATSVTLIELFIITEGTSGTLEISFSFV